MYGDVILTREVAEHGLVASDAGTVERQIPRARPSCGMTGNTVLV
jgi:hypothetical protein